MTPVRHAAIAALCSVVFSAGAFAQTPASTSPKPTTTVGVVPPPKPPIPDTVLFQLYFLQVDAMKSMSDKMGAAGKGVSRARISKMTRTNDTEASLIEETATSCTAQLNSLANATADQRTALIKQFKQGDAAAAADANRQGTQLDADRDKLLTGCMQSLQKGLGDARYQQVKTAVYFSLGPAITVQPPKTDSGATATTTAPSRLRGHSNVSPFSISLRV
ncbi:MAG: hypothetical protein ABI824_02795 [Acidobacteriota bacterium]